MNPYNSFIQTSKMMNIGRRQFLNLRFSSYVESNIRPILISGLRTFCTKLSSDEPVTFPETIPSSKVEFKLDTSPIDVPSPRIHNSFVHHRSHTCGELRLSHEGSAVRVCGWLQFKRLDKFLTIKDSYGVVQLLLRDDGDVDGDDDDDVSNIPLESVVAAEGVVRSRPSGMRNPKMPTGDVEVVVDRLEVLNACRETLPFLTSSKLKHGEANEALRLRHRYLDLRSDRMQANLRFRSSLLMRMREYLHNLNGFVEVETPTLFRRTPGGAREFIVPTDIPGQFFCLPQSPQQFKQLLMVGGVDRYFQVARCYRDEGTKRDRQPEFTQLDVELSFVDRDGVKSLIEGLLVHCLSLLVDERSLSHVPAPSLPFPTITYLEAMTSYGVDKPDARFGMKIVDLAETLGPACGSDVLDQCLSAGGIVKCVRVENGRSLLTKAEWKTVLAMEEKISQERENHEGRNSEAGGNSEFVLIYVNDDLSWKTSSPPVRFVDAAARLRLSLFLQLRPKDVVVLTHGFDALARCRALGKLRLKLAKTLEAKGLPVYDRPFAWLWVEDFPLFFLAEDVDAASDPPSSTSTKVPLLESAHHPFTAPHPDDVHLLTTDPPRCRGLHFDLVLNGNEIGGGSVRIHDGDFQRKILTDFLKVDCDQLEHLLKALDSGAPPHGGIALGIDRLVAILVGSYSIRDVIAFPKSADLKDMMSNAPAAVNQVELDHYNIAVVEKIQPK